MIDILCKYKNKVLWTFHRIIFAVNSQENLKLKKFKI